MQKQEVFLNKLASKLGRDRRSGVTPPKWGEHPGVRLYEGKTKEELIQQFIDNLNALNTEVDRIKVEDVPAALEKVIRKFEVNSCIQWDDERLDPLNLPSFFISKGVQHLTWNKSSGEETLRHSAATMDLGITYADLGLAETGTVMLFNGGGRGRSVSLLPPVFLCILSEDTIVPRLTQAVQHIKAKAPEGLPACINFITGPSRTGDIEMDLALGVHGPGKVHVILLNN
ncbi:lactate utilization protein C [Ammoniphilus sp. CFH 90114]|uniref:LutC/YkgG family protein n=1 Tax=Ammoniphilus sp. CFH 90114 TaxID=2493665 RepID=UPI00100FB47D|nr:lactate utilization protein C [Ammoniphilus sp. CFH 90114]RXT13464.1 lactate utilization protein C [Ammoniphilus sp. CFH 90114]